MQPKEMRVRCYNAITPLGHHTRFAQMHSLYDCFRQHLVLSVSSCWLRSRQRLYICHKLPSATTHLSCCVADRLYSSGMYRRVTELIVLDGRKDSSPCTFRVTSRNTRIFAHSSPSLPPHCVVFIFTKDVQTSQKQAETIFKNEEIILKRC